MRLATVTKKNPKTMISSPSSSLLPNPWPGMNGSTAITSTSTPQPARTNVSGRSRSVRACPLCPSRCRSDATLSLNEETMVGSVLSRVMNPPAATAPAPICRT